MTRKPWHNRPAENFAIAHQLAERAMGGDQECCDLLRAIKENDVGRLLDFSHPVGRLSILLFSLHFREKGISI
jgi:hypothetical protein